MSGGARAEPHRFLREPLHRSYASFALRFVLSNPRTRYNPPVPTTHPTRNVNPARLPIRSLALLLVAASALAQDTPAPVHKSRAPHPEQLPYNINTIFLDPAHGGDDPGTRLGPNSLEKDATLAFAERLRVLLSRDAFTLVTTRAMNPDLPPPGQPNASGLDQRVELANRSRALACLILHASSAGHGIHLFTSSLPALTPSSAETSGPRPIVPWNTAQAASLQASQQLAADLAASIDGIRIPLVTGHISIKPIDSLTCPAILVELAPLAFGTSQTIASDPAYQERVAQALASGLHAWRAHVQTQIDAQTQLQTQTQAQNQAQSTQSTPASPAPKSRPTPKPKPIPEEFPAVAPPAPVLPPRPPAPIVRRPPEPAPAPVPPSAPPPGARP